MRKHGTPLRDGKRERMAYPQKALFRDVSLCGSLLFSMLSEMIRKLTQLYDSARR